MRLKGKVAVVTGGGQGIGRAYALRFAREGAKIVVAEINEENGKKVAAEVQEAGGEAIAVKTDVSSEDSCNEMARAAHAQFGSIDILMNNAAIFYGMDRQNQTLEYFNRILSVNLNGVWLATRAVEKYMKRQRSGKIINQSSTAAYMGNTGFVDTTNPDLPSPPFHYSVAKIGVNGMTKYFAGALGPWGINVNAIAPGVTLTEATKTVVPEEMISMIVMMTALKKALEPDDLTGPAVFLASEDSNLMTGQVLVVDGGMFMLG